MKRRRSGFSLAELLVAVVLLGIVGGALTRMVVDQMRLFDTLEVSRSARSVARNSMNVLMSELRMVQDSGGITAVAGNNKSVTLNVPYRMGVLCNTGSGVTTVSMLPVDSLTLARAVFAGFGWRNRTTGRYVVVPSAGVAPIESGSTSRCTGSASGEAGVATMTIDGQAGQVLDIVPAVTMTTTAMRGAPVMFYQSITYSFAASSMYPGKIGLWRSVAGGDNEELMAPFTADARFRYYQAGDDTSRTTAPALSAIRGLALVLNSEGSRTPAGHDAPSQTRMMTSVFFKNTRSF
jgi:prepilin-type N-terminal cleavage/methylation domain-containing protein